MNAVSIKLSNEPAACNDYPVIQTIQEITPQLIGST